jgi:hypothetical protein
MNIYGQVGWRAAANVNPSSGQDADALAFITAATITNTTQQNAINTLVTDLKGYGIWTKMKALYPFVGGTAAQHRFNLKDPRTINAAFYLDFLGGGTHNSNGYQPNGTTSYADTFLVPSSALSLNSTHISYYSLTDSNSGWDMGATSIGSGPTRSYLGTKLAGSTYSRLNNLGLQGIVSNANGTGFYILSRTNSLNYASFKGVTKTQIVTETSTTLPVYSFTLGAYYENLWYYGNKQSAFASIGDGLTDTEAANFYTAVQKYQTTLGRNV